VILDAAGGRRHPPYESAIKPHVPIRGPRTDRAGGNIPQAITSAGAMSHTDTAGLPEPGPYLPGHTQEGKGTLGPLASDGLHAARGRGSVRAGFNDAYDSLWLELFIVSGAIGIFLAIAVFVMLARQLALL
jgi:hypothetical protein